MLLLLLPFVLLVCCFFFFVDFYFATVLYCLPFRCGRCSVSVYCITTLAHTLSFTRLSRNRLINYKPASQTKRIAYNHRAPIQNHFCNVCTFITMFVLLAIFYCTTFLIYVNCLVLMYMQSLMTESHVVCCMDKIYWHGTQLAAIDWPNR